MRRAKDGQGTFEFQPATLKLTDDYHERYRRIGEVLVEVPEILKRAICQLIEGASLREIVVRVDDSNFLRSFCRFGPDKMMGQHLVLLSSERDSSSNVEGHQCSARETCGG
jgi:hypothetical protein